MDDAIFRPRAGGGLRVAVAKRPTNTGRRFASHPPHGPCGDDAVAQDKEGPGSIVFVLESMTQRPCHAIVTRVNETGGNRSVRPGYGLGRYQTGPNSKFKFEFKKIKILKPVIPAGKPVKPVYRPQFKI